MEETIAQQSISDFVFMPRELEPSFDDPVKVLHWLSDSEIGMISPSFRESLSLDPKNATSERTVNSLIYRVLGHLFYEGPQNYTFVIKQHFPMVDEETLRSVGNALTELQKNYANWITSEVIQIATGHTLVSRLLEERLKKAAQRGRNLPKAGGVTRDEQLRYFIELAVWIKENQEELKREIDSMKKTDPKFDEKRDIRWLAMEQLVAAKTATGSPELLEKKAAEAEEKGRELRKKEEEIEELNDTIKDLQAKLDKANQLLSELRSDIGKETKAKEPTISQGEKQELEKQIATLKSELSATEKKLTELEALFSGQVKAKDEELRQMEEKVKELQEGIKFAKETITKLEERAETLQSRNLVLQSTEQQVVVLKQQAQAKDNEIAQLKEQIAESQELEQKIGDLELEINVKTESVVAQTEENEFYKNMFLAVGDTLGIDASFIINRELGQIQTYLAGLPNIKAFIATHKKK